MRQLLRSEGREIADRFRPTIYQEYENDLDLIQSFGNSSDPVLYFLAYEDDAYWYISWLIYHKYDWADYKVPKVLGIKLSFLSPFIKWLNKADSHKDDTEVASFRIHKRKKIIDIVTVAHHNHVFAWNTQLKVFCESQGHALRPFKKKLVIDSKNLKFYPPNSYRVENIGDWSELKKYAVKRKLKKNGGANWIDGHIDGDLRLLTANGRYRSKGLMHEAGDICLRPNKLFKIGEVTHQ